MFYLLRTTLSIFFLLLLTACFDDDSDMSSPSLIYHPSVTENFEAVEIEGVASKGILSQARITIYAADDGFGDTLVLGRGRTNDLGEYRVAIPYAYQGPLVVQVETSQPSSGDSTQMVCDNAEGCGVLGSLSTDYDSNSNGFIDFGERFPLSDDFRMRAVHFSSGERGPIVVHVTPLTHLVDALTSSFGDAYSLESILKADSQVADLFSLTQRLSSIQPLNLTNLELLQSIHFEQLRYNLFAAAFAGLASQREELGGMLVNLTDTFVANGGQFPLVDASLFGTGFDMLLSEAAGLAEKLQSENSAFVEHSLLLKSELVEVRRLANKLVLTDAVPSDSFNLDALEKAKKMVSDMLLWQGSIALDVQHGLGFTEQAMELKTITDDAQVVTAFLAAAKYSPVLAVMPVISSNEDAIEYFCGQISGTLGFWCTELLSNYDLQDLDCSRETSPACEILADKLLVSIPTLEEGLKATYAVFGHAVNVVGFAYEHEIDLRFHLSEFDLNDKIEVIGEGTLKNDQSVFEIFGKVNLSGTQDNAQLQRASEIAISVSELYGEDSSVSLRYGENAMAVVSFNAMSFSGRQSEVTVTSSLEDWGKRSSRVKIESTGKQLVFTHLNDNEAKYNVSNQDGIELTLDLDKVDNGKVGDLILDGETLANVTRENNSYFIEFNDGDRQEITALMF